jgi:predicted nucleic acid-binding Zn ribbon protein
MKKNMNNLSDIGSILNKTVQTIRQRPDNELTRIWGMWEEIAGSEIASYARPSGFKNNLLIIKVTNSVWLHHLSMTRQDMMDRINRAFGKEIIREIKFTIGSIK